MLNALFSRLRTFSSRAVSNEPIHLLLRPEQLLSDRYTILEQLGRGRQATVWLAEDRNVYENIPHMSRDVKLKSR